MNCRPNDLCVVVAEDPGCECNIGATLRVREAVHCEGLPSQWRFVDESRPLKLADGETVCWSDEVDRAYIADTYLVPIRPPAEGARSQEIRALPADAGRLDLHENMRAFRAMREHGVCP